MASSMANYVFQRINMFRDKDKKLSKNPRGYKESSKNHECYKESSKNPRGYSQHSEERESSRSTSTSPCGKGRKKRKGSRTISRRKRERQVSFSPIRLTKNYRDRSTTPPYTSRRNRDRSWSPPMSRGSRDTSSTPPMRMRSPSKYRGHSAGHWQNISHNASKTIEGPKDDDLRRPFKKERKRNQEVDICNKGSGSCVVDMLDNVCSFIWEIMYTFNGWLGIGELNEEWVFVSDSSSSSSEDESPDDQCAASDDEQ